MKTTKQTVVVVDMGAALMGLGLLMLGAAIVGWVEVPENLRVKADRRELQKDSRDSQG